MFGAIVANDLDEPDRDAGALGSRRYCVTFHVGKIGQFCEPIAQLRVGYETVTSR